MRYETFGFIGGGRVTRIILTALKRAGKLPGSLIVSDISTDVLDRLQKDFASIVVTSTDNSRVAACNLVFLALHPPAIGGALAQLQSSLSSDTVVVSLSPKITIARIQEILVGHARIVRMIPNAPSVVNKGYNPIAFSGAITASEKEELLDVCRCLGDCPEVPEEDLEAYAVIMAMGPTYFWFQWLTLVELGQSFGLSDAAAKEGIMKMGVGALETLFGSSLKVEEVLDLIPVKPLAEDEEMIRNIYRTKLSALHTKLKG